MPYWCRGGALGVTRRRVGQAAQHARAEHGDTLGGLTTVGGIAAALFKRAMTGEASVVDVSLLSVGAYCGKLSVDISLMSGEPWVWPPNELPGAGEPGRRPVRDVRTHSSGSTWRCCSPVATGPTSAATSVART
ncbi:MAG: CoA transferase [Acidimicrobiia bacterium]